MLAPTKKLWSTPLEVIDKAIELLSIGPHDKVFDIGAGDGRFIIRCHQTTGAQCVGVEMNEETGRIALNAIRDAQLRDENCRLIIGNALEQNYASATVIFMYLIPHGLKRMLPILRSIPQPVRVATFMNPLPQTPHKRVEKIGTMKVPEAKWPLYIYELSKVD